MKMKGVLLSKGRSYGQLSRYNKDDRRSSQSGSQDSMKWKTDMDKLLDQGHYLDDDWMPRPPPEYPMLYITNDS